VWEDVNRIELAQDKDQEKDFCKHGDEPSVSLNVGNFFE
jgi:pantothenate kinase